jgi:hypothetical protein
VTSIGTDIGYIINRISDRSFSCGSGKKRSRNACAFLSCEAAIVLSSDSRFGTIDSSLMASAYVLAHLASFHIPLRSLEASCSSYRKSLRFACLITAFRSFLADVHSSSLTGLCRSFFQSLLAFLSRITAIYIFSDHQALLFWCGFKIRTVFAIISSKFRNKVFRYLSIASHEFKSRGRGKCCAYTFIRYISILF